MLLANAGLPMIAVVWPASWLLFVPIVLVEWLVARRILKVPWKEAFYASLLGNLASTLLAIPLAWAGMLLIAMLSPLTYPGDFVSVVNNVLFHSAWLVPWHPPRPWLIPASALTLCVPFFFASVGTEALVARGLLRSQYPAAPIGRWAWRANGVTYGAIMIALAILIWTLPTADRHFSV